MRFTAHPLPSLGANFNFANQNQNSAELVGVLLNGVRVYRS
jgi:hypothetical protein